MGLKVRTDPNLRGRGNTDDGYGVGIMCIKNY